MATRHAHVLALQHAVAAARRTVDGLAAIGPRASCAELDSCRSKLDELSDHLASAARHPSFDDAVKQRLVDLRAQLDSHLLAATSLEYLELPERSAAMLVRGGRTVAAELEHTVCVL